MLSHWFPLENLDRIDWWFGFVCGSSFWITNNASQLVKFIQFGCGSILFFVTANRLLSATELSKLKPYELAYRLWNVHLVNWNWWYNSIYKRTRYQKQQAAWIKLLHTYTVVNMNLNRDIGVSMRHTVRPYHC